MSPPFRAASFCRAAPASRGPGARPYLSAGEMLSRSQQGASVGMSGNQLKLAQRKGKWAVEDARRGSAGLKGRDFPSELKGISVLEQ